MTLRQLTADDFEASLSELEQFEIKPLKGMVWLKPIPAPVIIQYIKEKNRRKNQNRSNLEDMLPIIASVVVNSKGERIFSGDKPIDSQMTTEVFNILAMKVTKMMNAGAVEDDDAYDGDEEDDLVS